jgi:peptide/nickel transport system substrate-binding protein
MKGMDMTRMRSRWTVLGLGVLIAGAAIIVAGCGSSSSSGGSSAGTAARGGTYRVESTDFGFSDNFDPTGEYTTNAWGIYRGLLIRTLVGYKMIAGVAGNQLVPDLATSVPTPTDNSQTWTFTLKSGVRFGPPVNRVITSHDIAYAFERIDTPSLAAQYGFYYSNIAGWNAYAAGKTKTISGISTPNNQTITFQLTSPTPDFLYRISLPAAGPIPEEVAKCFPNPGGYGRDLISSGPYMVQGSSQLNITSCATMQPLPGFDPTSKLILVRNPNYNPATDSTSMRTALPNGFSFVINTNQTDIFNRIRAGLADDSLNTPPASIVSSVVANSSEKSLIKSGIADGTSYISMNLTQPPFDDIHVRKAVNLIMDKAGLQQASGGPLYGQIATHIVPNTMYNNASSITSYDPYATPNSAGELSAAEAQMRLSKYDPKQDGMCDVGVCKNIFTITGNTVQALNAVPVVASALAKIGITVNVRELPESAEGATVSTVAKNIPLALSQGWAKDYADPSTFMTLFESSSIAPVGNINLSLVGLTPALATALHVTIPKGDSIPSIDAQAQTCAQTAASAGRQDCWIALDKYLMENVVPWVPYLTPNQIHLVSSAVTAWDYDQSSDTTAFSHVAVNPAKQSS